MCKPLVALLACLGSVVSSHAAIFQETGSFGSANLISPFGITLDGQGNSYVTDFGNATIKVFNSSNALINTLGSGTLTAAANVVFAPNGMLYVADGSRILPMSTSGVAGTPFGTFDGTFGIAASANSTIFVTDTGNDRVLAYSPAGALQMTLTSANSVAFNHPYGVAVDGNGKIYVADSFNDRVAIFDSAGNYQSSFSTVIPAWNDTHPKELVVAPDGTIYMSLGDPGFAAFTSTGQLLDTFGGLDRAAGVALSGNTLYGVELGRHVVYVFQVPEPNAAGLLALASFTTLTARRARRKRGKADA